MHKSNLDRFPWVQGKNSKKVWVATDKGMIVSPRFPKWEPALQRLKTVGENMEMLMFYRGCGRVLLGDVLSLEKPTKNHHHAQSWRKKTIWKTFPAWNAWNGSNMFVGRTILHSWSAWPPNSWGYGLSIWRLTHFLIQAKTVVDSVIKKNMLKISWNLQIHLMKNTHTHTSLHHFTLNSFFPILPAPTQKHGHIFSISSNL